MKNDKELLINIEKITILIIVIVFIFILNKCLDQNNNSSLDDSNFLIKVMLFSKI